MRRSSASLGAPAPLCEAGGFRGPAARATVERDRHTFLEPFFCCVHTWGTRKLFCILCSQKLKSERASCSSSWPVQRSTRLEASMKGLVENFFASTSHCFVGSRCGPFVSDTKALESKAWSPSLGPRERSDYSLYYRLCRYIYRLGPDQDSTTLA